MRTNDRDEQAGRPGGRAEGGGSHAGSSSAKPFASDLLVTGIVQGVGFRPTVYNLAVGEGLSGWVLNASDGVHIHLEGHRKTVERFPDVLRAHAPAASRIERIAMRRSAPEGSDGFAIRFSDDSAQTSTLVSPDLATCDDCVRELFDAEDRRYHYPFVNCTACGPRFTIIDRLPYDRPTTSMSTFQMCPACAHEYADPANRRFHAQPDACFVCGPQLLLTETPHGEQLPGTLDPQLAEPIPADPWATGEVAAAHEQAARRRSDAIVQRVAQLLLAGRIVAIKGLGGFHLACDATNAEAVHTLRERKHRPRKPLAVMVASVRDARRLCRVSETERKVLTGTARPIVLLRRLAPTAADPEVAAATTAIAGAASPTGAQAMGATGATGATGAGAADMAASADPIAGPVDHVPLKLADEVAFDLPEVGLMLPSTPLQHLLMHAVGGRPLVMTSGNVSGEPIISQDDHAVWALAPIADAILGNDRPIRSRYDDSVVRVIASKPQQVRRARGIAPDPLPLPERLSGSDLPQVLACGPEQKSTLALTRDGQAFVSQHIGDLENAASWESYNQARDTYERLFDLNPQVIACDMHPEYLATKWAQAHAADVGQPLVEVQHHHAHIAAVTGEHGYAGPVLGVALDGTGFGPDGAIWGGELLVGNWAHMQRSGHLRYLPMPGGAAAIRHPMRMAEGMLLELGLADRPAVAQMRERMAPGEWDTVEVMVRRNLNCPRTSSAGRLLDACAALLGICDQMTYDGEPAVELEAAALAARPMPAASAFYRFDLDGNIIDPTAAIKALLGDLAAGGNPGTIARNLLEGMASSLVDVVSASARARGLSTVALGGGVFMNRLLIDSVASGLERQGLTVLTPQLMPANDGCISYGQAVVALARVASGEVKLGGRTR